MQNALGVHSVQPLGDLDHQREGFSGLERSSLQVAAKGLSVDPFHDDPKRFLKLEDVVNRYQCGIAEARC
ncbi:MAG: hypothetical protein AAGM22_20205 [Acidobacteriota bacterium]